MIKEIFPGEDKELKIYPLSDIKFGVIQGLIDENGRVIQRFVGHFSTLVKITRKRKEYLIPCVRKVEHTDLYEFLKELPFTINLFNRECDRIKNLYKVDEKCYKDNVRLTIYKYKKV